MKVLVLSPCPERLAPALAATGDTMVSGDERIDAGALAAAGVEFVVSYGYRHIIGADVISRLPGRIVNLHISLLPWNRGSDPNFWSFFDDTPKGVSIHRIDRGLDTGDVLAQALIIFGGGETLATSYARLRDAIEELFARTWPAIRLGQQPARPQRGRGSYHRARDKAPLFAQLAQGWNTPVEVVEAMGRARREKSHAIDGTTRTPVLEVRR